MTSSARRIALAVVFLALFSVRGSAQVISQPTPVPLVTADAEFWYLNGDPITYAGNTYYPAGAWISFNSNEMVRSGFHFGVPLYVRTTDEPYSVIYVPLARGFVRPYMRRRSGDVAGTAGTAPLSGTAAMYSPAGALDSPAQAGGPPSLVAGPPSDALGQPRAPIPAVASQATEMDTRPALPATSPSTGARVVGNSGRAAAQVPDVPTHTRIGPRPEGLNAVYVNFRDRRWFSEESVVELDRARMIQVGDHFGFPVYVDRETPEQRIYVATAIGGSLVAAYSDKRKED